MNYRALIVSRCTVSQVQRMVRAGDLAPAALDMEPAEAIRQWQQANALSDHLAAVELARY